MSVVSYCRVSTTMQAKDGISLETQRQKIESWAEYNEKPIRGIYVDEGISGKTKEGRPQLQLALAALQKGDSFVVYDLSRFARNTGDSLVMLGQIQAKGADFVSINQRIDTTTPQGRMMFSILSSFNTLEREQTAEKVSDNMQRLSKDGLLGKKSCFGYRWVKKGAPFEPVPEQQAIIEHVRQLLQKDATLNVQRIVDFLNSDERARAAMKGKLYYYRTVRQWMVDNDLIVESGKTKKRRGLEQRPQLIPVPLSATPAESTTQAIPQQ
jgi:DNA invertase Pin-like site-specific DNA recombinase